jgi:hypothetical protein
MEVLEPAASCHHCWRLQKEKFAELTAAGADEREATELARSVLCAEHQAYADHQRKLEQRRSRPR